ncbi:MAG TPA: ABC transporter substrate-binding protein [Anaeromyxobacteraceae bacterium]|nr:ABC transporter substrate-binding protein [Anaeromyxobacteraceae bacterium]
MAAKRRLLPTLLALVAAALLPGWASAQQEIKIGGIFDLTGVTGDVGKIFAQGVQDAVAHVNENGGINGKKIVLIGVDYAYKIDQARAAYKRLTTDEKVVMIQGWGTGDTEALKDFVTNDKVPYFSGSFAAPISDPGKYPYNFFVAPTYSDQLRAWLEWVKKDWGAKAGKAKVAFMYGDNAYGRAPLAAGRAYAKEIGLEVVDEEVLPPNFQDATSQLLNMKQKAVDYAYINVTTTGVRLVLGDAKKLGLAIKFGSNPYGFSETLVAVAGPLAEGVTGVMPDVPYGAPVPEMKTVEAVHQKYRASEKGDTMYIRGFSYVLVWAEGLKRADKAGQLNGPGIKAALETLTDFSTGGLTEPVTYTPTDHRPTTTTAIYQVQNGKLVKIAQYTMPRKPDWLGL